MIKYSNYSFPRSASTSIRPHIFLSAEELAIAIGVHEKKHQMAEELNKIASEVCRKYSADDRILK